jgi:RNA polymerase sigma-70 factor (ECF subfamily)
MTGPSDHHLLAAWHAGDARAFTALVHRHQSALLRHARGLLGSDGAHEDVVQEVFLKLARERLEPQAVPADGGGGLAAWLHTVTRNACMDTLRSESRRRARERSVATTEAAPGGQQIVEAEDTRARVERAIAELPVDQREVLVLRLLAGRSYREIAEVTGKKVGTVGWLISEGVKALSVSLSTLMPAEGSSTGDGLGIA